MPKRLNVLLDEQEYQAIQGCARRQRLTVAEWVRQALREARQHDSVTIDAKLRVIAEAAEHEFPTADIDVMLDEIEQGRRIG